VYARLFTLLAFGSGDRQADPQSLPRPANVPRVRSLPKLAFEGVLHMWQTVAARYNILCLPLVLRLRFLFRSKKIHQMLDQTILWGIRWPNSKHIDWIYGPVG